METGQNQAAAPSLVMADKDFDFIRGIVYDTAGIRLKDTKRTLVINRLRKRLVALKIGTFEEYCNLLKTRSGLRAELGEIIDAITTNETYFFRELKHFDCLNQYVFPAAAEKSRHINIWSAACSTGQEPYTIAIAALEYMAAHRLRLNVSILGADLCTTAVRESKEGFYHERKMKGMPPALLSKYFDREGEGYRIKKEPRALVRFQQMNLLTEKPMQKFDVIFCRNVLIYFDDASQGRAIGNLRDCLARDGLLMIGHAESLYRHSEGFESVRIANTVVYRKTEAANAPAAPAPCGFDADKK